MIDPNLIVFRHHEHDDQNDPRFGEVDVVGTLVFQCVATIGRHYDTFPTREEVEHNIKRKLWQDAYGDIHRDIVKLRAKVMKDLLSPIQNLAEINAEFERIMAKLNEGW